MTAAAPANARLGPLTSGFLTTAGVQAVNVFTGILLARLLGPEARGELAAVLLWPGLLAAVGTLGMAEATTYYAARSEAKVGVLAASSFVIALAQSLVLVAVGLAVIPLVLAQYDAEITRLAYVYLLGYVPVFLLTVYAMNILQGLLRFASFYALRLLVVLATAVILGGLALAGELGVEGAVLAYLGAYVLTGIVALVLLFRVERIPFAFDRALARGLLGFGLRSHTSSVSSLLNERLDQLVISVFLAPAQLGLYVIAITLSSLTNLVGTTVATVVLPAVARLAPGPERNRAVQRFVRITLGVSVAVTLPLLLLAPTVITTVFGAAYAGAGGVARILLVAAVVLVTGRVLGTVLKAVGRPLDAGAAELAALATTLAGLLVLLPALVLIGAGIASLLAYSVSTAWMVRRAGRALDLSARSLLLLDRAELTRLVRLVPVLGGAGR